MTSRGMVVMALAMTIATQAHGQRYFARQHLTPNGSGGTTSTPKQEPKAGCTGTPVPNTIHRGFDYNATRHFNVIQNGPTPFQQALDHCRSMSGITYCSIFDQGWTAMSHWYSDSAGTVGTSDPNDYTITCEV